MRFRRWLRSESIHNVFITLIFAVPMTIILGREVAESGNLTLRTGFIIFGFSLLVGAITAKVLWETWSKKRRPPALGDDES
ncbi:MAG TPA: hypothetical protein VFR59_06250 [Steroidobacteraceae bacterium]|nr:hypothetical protein [Steroidobacteraceae bacterium]